MTETAKKNGFASLGGGIVKFFKDMKAETKKIIWPTPTKIAKDTTVVLVSVVVIGIFVWSISFIFTYGVKLIVGS